jgi:hypothetical protein
MKTTVFIFLCFMVVSVSNAQVVDLRGTWTMYEMTYVTGEGTQKMTEDQMKANGMSTDFFFMEEGKFRQTSNMSGSGTMDTYEGTWKIAAPKLIITLRIGEQNLDVDYTYELKENVLVLTRESPDGTMKIVSTYRKEQ